MRGIASEIKILSPKNLKEALQFLSKENSSKLHWKVLAGATDLAVEFNAGKLKHHQLINIWPLRQELNKIKFSKTGVTIGAMATFTEIQNDLGINKYFPNLAAASRLVGGVQIQNRGTIGGNIANASPAGDSLPALLAYDALLNIQDSDGSRKIPITEFYRGYKDLNLFPRELIVSVEIEFKKHGTRHYFRKVGTRQAQAISKVVAAGTVQGKTSIQAVTFCLGSVGPTPLRCEKLEKYLTCPEVELPIRDRSVIDGARQTVTLDISPQDDIRSTKSYRLFASQGLVEDFLTSYFRPSRIFIKDRP